MASKWRTVQVFISSTFRDMHAERDILIKEVFPELRRRLAAHRMHFADIDLRWGVTQAQAENGRVVQFCLDQIDACRPLDDEQSRPFFLGLLGQRYGWVPRAFTPECLLAHRWLDEHPEYGGDEAARHSITAMEIIYGVALQPLMQGNSFFYIRGPEFLAQARQTLQQRLTGDAAELASALDTLEIRFLGDSEERGMADRLEALIERIRGFRLHDGATLPCRDYDGWWDPDLMNREDPGKPRGRISRESLRPFARQVLDDLWQALVAQYAQLESGGGRESINVGDLLLQESDSHQRFAESRLRVFVGRETELRALFGFAAHDDDCPCVVLGPSGSGKSALLSRFADAYAQAHPDHLLVTHFVGATARSSDLREMLGRLTETLRTQLQLPNDVGTKSPDVLTQFQEVINAVPADRRVVLLIDALDQLDDTHGAHLLTWLPVELPEHVKVVVSCVEGIGLGGPVYASLQQRIHLPLPVSALSLEQRRKVISEVPLLWAKSLEPQQIALLLENPASGNPLFLSVALEELRGFGGYETLEDRIAAFPTNADDPATEIFLQVLGRLEDEYDSRVVSTALTSLAASRSGLSEAELLDLVADVDRDTSLFPMLLQLRPYLLQRGTLLDCYHGSLRRAIRQTWLVNETSRRHAHHVLATYFREQPDWLDPETPNVRRLEELPWQLTQACEWNHLEEILCSLPFIEAKSAAQRVDDLSQDYQRALVVWPGFVHVDPFAVSAPRVRAEPTEDAASESRSSGAATGLVDPAAVPEYQPSLYGESDVVPAHYFSSDCGSTTALAGMRRTVAESGAENAAMDSADRGLANPSPRTLSPVERIMAFSRFVTSHAQVLRGVDREVIPLARNHADGGPVVEAAETLLACRTTPWIARTNRPRAASKQPLFSRVLDHSKEINALAVTPDGGTAVTICNRDRTLRRWNLRTGQCEYLVRDKGAKLSLSADGHTLAGIPGPGFDDRDDDSATQEELNFHADLTAPAACIWDALTGARRHLLTGHTEAVHAVALAREADLVVSGGDDRTIRVWNVGTGQCLRTIDGFDSRVKDVAVTDDGRLVAALSVDNCIRLWDVRTGDCCGALLVQPLPERRPSAVALQFDMGWSWGNIDGADLNAAVGRMTGTVTSIVMTPDGRLLASLNQTGDVDIWDLSSGKRVRRLSCGGGADSSVKAIELSADGRVLAVVRQGLALWDVARGECVREFSAFELWIQGVRLTDDCRLAVTWSGDPFAMTENRLRVWDIVDGQLDADTARPADHVLQLQTSSFAVTPDGVTGLSGSMSSHMLREWDFPVEAPRQTLQTPNDVITSVALSPDGQLALWGTYQTQVMHENPHRGGHVRVAFLPNQTYLRCFRMGLSPALCATLSPAGTDVFAISDNDGAHGWDLLTGRRMLQIPEALGVSLDIGPDGRLLAVGGSEGHVSLWDAVSGRHMAGQLLHTRAVNRVAISPDGRAVVSASLDGTICLWDLATDETRTLGEHHGESRSVRLTADARWILSAGFDQAIRLWDRTTGLCVAMHNCGSPAATLSGLVPQRRFAAGCLNGDIPFLQLMRAEIERPWVTAVRYWHCDYHDVMDRWLPGGTASPFRDSLGGDAGAMEAARQELSDRAAQWRPLLDEGELLGGRFDPELRTFCPHCGHVFAVSGDVLETIREWSGTLSDDAPPSHALPQAAWDDPRLQTWCPTCFGQLRFNPFLVERPDAPTALPTAAAWQTPVDYDRFTFERRLQEHNEFAAKESNVANMVELALLLAPMQLGMGDEDAFNASMGLLVYHGAIAAGLMARQLSADDVGARRFAARALALLDPQHAQCAVDALQAALRDDDEPTRKLAADTLATLQPGSTRGLDALLAEWQDLHNANPWTTAQRLAEDASPAAVAALTEVFPDGQRDAQMAAAVALASLGQAARAAVPALLVARDSLDPILQIAVDAAIARIMEHE